jgi:hypothetical protein
MNTKKEKEFIQHLCNTGVRGKRLVGRRRKGVVSKLSSGEGFRGEMGSTQYKQVCIQEIANVNSKYWTMRREAADA